MNRVNANVLLGGGLILLGVLFLLEKIGILRGAVSLFWGVLFVLGAVFFIRIYTVNAVERWWAIIPGMVLLGMGGGALLPESLRFWDSALFLGPLALAFWIIYLTDHSRWWAIIPGGVLATLAVVSVLDRVSGLATGALFFVGLGLTFLLLTFLPNPVGRHHWALIPGVILLVLGAFLGLAAQTSLMTYFWPGLLILIGCVLIFFYFFRRN